MNTTIDHFILFVNEQIEYQAARSEYYNKQGDTVRADSYEKRVGQFQQLAEFLAQNCYNNSSTILSQSIYLSPDDIRDIPPELLKQLNISESDKQDMAIIESINNVGGIASIDKILVSYYHLKQEVFDRQKLMAKLYRMSVKGLIYSHPTKKGVYTTLPIQTNEQSIMEAGDNDE